MKVKPPANQTGIVNLDAAGGTPNEHSVLILKAISDKSRLYKLGVGGDGEFKETPSVAAAADNATRLVFGLAGADMPDGRVQPQQSHASFAILPIKPDPTSAHYSCYLLNVNTLYPENAWTRGPWNVPPPADDLERGRVLIVATEDGKLFRVPLQDGHAVKLIDSKHCPPDVWRLLRNGCVVGLAQSDEPTDPPIVPIVNLAAFVAKDIRVSQPDLDIRGTFDFKWPPRSKIRIRVDPPDGHGDTAPVAFSLLPQIIQDAALKLVRGCANKWLGDDPAKNPGGLSFEFVPAGSQNYDVFVNLDPLASTPPRGKEDTHVSAPESTLGSYAQRTPLGEPTSWCGLPEGLLGTDGKPISPDDYYGGNSGAFQQIVLHELGHILGLPHLHQHPGWADPRVNLTDSELSDTFKSKLGLKVDETTIKSDITSAWPEPSGAPYSDWPKLTVEQVDQGPGCLAADSVMLGHPLRGIFRGDPGGVRVEFRDAPGDFDLAWLKNMYERGQG